MARLFSDLISLKGLNESLLQVYLQFWLWSAMLDFDNSNPK